MKAYINNRYFTALAEGQNENIIYKLVLSDKVRKNPDDGKFYYLNYYYFNVDGVWTETTYWKYSDIEAPAPVGPESYVEATFDVTTLDYIPLTSNGNYYGNRQQLKFIKDIWIDDELIYEDVYLMTPYTADCPIRHKFDSLGEHSVKYVLRIDGSDQGSLCATHNNYITQIDASNQLQQISSNTYNFISFWDNYSRIETIILPDYITNIGEAWSYQTALKNIYCYATNAPTNPSQNKYGFSTGSVTLHVPVGATGYDAAHGWSDVYNIVYDL